ncbi:MAG: radical SAM family heme chaperone HemW, partial [Bacteroidota bacterium]|nr:radical SAM family heme chaperone HemW [Bacteroidota bacterium]
HVPYCKSKCIYCDFYSVTDRRPDSYFISTLLKELQLKKIDFGPIVISTIYFGGGTPTLLSVKEITTIIDFIKINFKTENNIEITVEANPDDLSRDYLRDLSKTEVNRLSIGIQSFNNDLLKFLERRHNSSQAIKAIRIARELGFQNISGDLIYSIPGMTGEIWKETLDGIFSLGIQHISAYDLIYEEDTPLHHQRKSGEITEVQEEKSEEFFTILRSEALKHGFRHYELSNFAKEGFISKHNSSYWSQKLYIGVGPSAHSYAGEIRMWNTSDLKAWQAGVNSGETYFETEQLSVTDKFNELLIKGLRTDSGIRLSTIRKEFGKEILEFLLKEAKKHLQSKSLIIENDSLILTSKSLFISDRIISDLFMIN